jgi:hypothetical protein
LIMAGAMGNCYDRLRLGYVRDFVHFHIDAINFDCAIFNFADNMLVIGALTLVIYALRPEKPQTDPPVDQRAPWIAHLAVRDVENAPAQAGGAPEHVSDDPRSEPRSSASLRSV